MGGSTGGGGGEDWERGELLLGCLRGLGRAKGVGWRSGCRGGGHAGVIV